MRKPHRLSVIVPLFILSLLLTVGQLSAATYRIVDTLDIDTVPSWFPVGFCLLTQDQNQYVAYYNEEHEMIVAQRKIDDREWQRTTLPSKIGWDSHNYITMAVDSAGHLHLSGNMHCVPLIYFRTEQPGDTATFQQYSMTDQQEQRCTYPRFVMDADENLLFTYRSGGSGNGRRFYNIYDVNAETWSRFLRTPLFDGEGERNAYPLGPVSGPDGLFHLVWVWRETPDCATNHHLSYARSRNLQDWETASGHPVELPFTLRQKELCVDPIPIGGGIINGCERLAFDSDLRPIISYHKLDENGHMQIFVARFQQEQWRRLPITTWNQQIQFSGRGAMPFIGIRISGLSQPAPGLFRITYRHRDYGSGSIFLDEQSLQPVESAVVVPANHPPELMKPTISFDGMRVRLAEDIGESSGVDRKYVLRWETLGAHHDRPRQPPLPPASRLQLVALQREE